MASFSALVAMGDRSVRDVLGQTVTYTPSVGDAVDVDGVFDAAYVRVDVGQPGVSSSGPAVFLTLTDLPSDPATDNEATFTIGEVEYRSWEIKKDGIGGVTVMLHQV